VLNRAVTKYDDTGVFPDALAVARNIKVQIEPGDKIITTDPEYAVMNFYLWYLKVPVTTGEAKKDNKNFFYVVPKGKSLDLLTAEPLEPWNVINGTKIYR